MSDRNGLADKNLRGDLPGYAVHDSARKAAAEPATVGHVVSDAAALRPLHVGKFVPPPYAGIESHVNTLLRALAPAVQSTLVASSPVGRPNRVSGDEPYRIIACRSFGTIASVAITPSLVPTVQRELASGRSNLLHIHAPNPWGDLAALRSHMDTPVVMTWHSDIVGKPGLFRLYQGMQERALRRVDRIILFTPKHLQGSTQLKVKGIEHKFVQVPIGVDFAALDATTPDPQTTEWIDRWAAGRRVILSAGRLVHYKGYEYLIDAISKLRSNAVLLLIGTGPLRTALKRRVEERGLGERIHFMGEVPPAVLTAALRRCDLFTLPSIEQSEAFGIASAEAMAFGMPTVVCELHNGVNYLNLAGQTSLVTPPRHITALADALDTLLLDDALRERMGIAAREWVRSEFDVAVMRDATLSLYQDLM